MAAGWMGGIEVGKIVLGRYGLLFQRCGEAALGSSSPQMFLLARDSQEAWLAGAIVPGGIMGIWTRCDPD